MPLDITPLLEKLEDCPDFIKELTLRLLEEAGCYVLQEFLLDQFSDVAAAYSIRQLASAYNGPLIRLRRDSDNAESDFSPDFDGNLTQVEITTWLGGADGFLVTFYDQSGNGNDLVQVTADDQPLYLDSGSNSRPAFSFDGVNDYLNTAFANVNSPHHVFTVSRMGVAYNNNDYMWDGGSVLQMGMTTNNLPNRVRANTGATGNRVDLVGADYYVLTSYYRDVAGDHYLRLNGVQVDADPGAAVGSATIDGITLGGRGDISLFGEFFMSEFILFGAVEQDNSIIEADQGDYYGIVVI